MDPQIALYLRVVLFVYIFIVLVSYSLRSKHKDP